MDNGTKKAKEAESKAWAERGLREAEFKKNCLDSTSEDCPKKCPCSIPTILCNVEWVQFTVDGSNGEPTALDIGNFKYNKASEDKKVKAEAKKQGPGGGKPGGGYVFALFVHCSGLGECKERETAE